MSIKSFFTTGIGKIVAASLGVVVIASALFYVVSRNKAGASAVFNPAFKSYVSAYTGGIVSKESPIQIEFVSDIVSDDQLNSLQDASLFKLNPDVKGTLMWTARNVLKFTPNEHLKSGQEYKVSFKIGKVMQMPEDLQVFEFNFQTLAQSFEVMVDGLSVYDVNDMKLQKLSGTLSTADISDNQDVERVLKATQGGNNLKITWTHNSGTSHGFQVEKVIRKDVAGKVELVWDGSPIGSDIKGNLSYDVPPIGEFVLVEYRAVQGEEQYAELRFSDPLAQKQDLEGMIVIKGVPDVRIVVEENIVKLYAPVRQVGTKTVTISQGIKNINKKSFPKTQQVEIAFEEIKPAVKLIGKGVILPGTDGLNFPFEAVSLKSVKVKVVRIYQNNVVQFLQVNKLDGNREIKRVGRTVLNKTIALNNTNVNDYGRWKSYALDLSTLIKTEPGAIYQVKIGFSKKDAYYSCVSTDDTAGITSTDEEDTEDDNFNEHENSYWDGSEDYYYYGNDYSYSDRENPCTNSYYNDSRSVTRNILASDIGIIAKMGTAGSLLFAVTDLKSTEPLQGATVELYNYQNQLMVKESTGNDGMVKIDLKKRPFLLVVKKNDQVGYLKLDDPSALAISNFDVSGAKVQKGIKGFLYGERGVWRPGDSLFLTFILEDKMKNIPDNAPVSFELSNPQGQVVKRLVSGNSVGGFYNFSTSTDQADPTGNWLATVKVGGATFTHPLKIETVMPNRLKIKIDFGVDKITATNNTLKGKLDVTWLHGAIAKNLDADINMQLLKSSTKFDKYPDFIFEDPGRDFTSESIEVFNGQIDENGHANINTKIGSVSNAPGALTANFKVKVMEEGGGFSVDRFSIPYFPYNAFVGIRMPEGDQSRNMLLTDTTHQVSVVTLDPDGKPLSGRKVEFQLYKLEWRWWWDNAEDNLSTYLENSYHQPLIANTVVSANGKATWKFKVKYPEWGRYYVRAKDAESNHSTGKIIYMDWPGWAGKSRERNQGGASMLSFSADKEKYNVGDDITLSIPGSTGGRALVSVESGSKVVDAYWVEMKENKTNFSFKASEQMAPNVFINVTLIQPHAQTKNDLPIRLYGIIPVKVENPATFLKPVISMKDELRPEENVSISVSEATGKRMNYTLAVVDEGLLDLTRFKTPEPWNHFYAREALGVNTWDMYEFVIGASAEKINRLLSIGGDGEIGKKDGNKTNRFKPVVKYLGPFQLEAGKTATHTFKMPQYVGSVKTMVVAGNEDGAFGSAEKATPVRKPVMILATLPRVLGPEEYVALPVNVFAMTKEVKNVTVDVSVNGLLEIVEEKSKTVSFSQPGDEVVNFYLKVKPGIGVAKVQVSAKSGSETAKHEIELEVRNPNAQMTKVFETLIQANQTWNSAYEPFGVVASNKGTLEVSSIPPLNLGSRLQYLVQYPYGCLEQTTSSVFPQLFVYDLIEAPKGTEIKIEEHIKAGIQRIKSFQNSEGGLSYWPGNYDYNAWGTSYAGHFLLEAEKKGYSIPEGLMTVWKKNQKKEAKNWTNHTQYWNSDHIQAYRLYTLALAKDPELGAMNRLRESKDLSPQAKWRLAAAYHLAGQSEVAKTLISNQSLSVKDYREMDYTYGSGLRDKAMILEVLSMMDMKVQAAPLVKEISASLSSQSWLSTQETAFCLLAMSKFANNGLKDSKLDYNYTLNSEPSVHAVTEAKISQVDMKVKNSKGSVTVKNNTKGVLYARIILTGIPKAGEEVAAENNLKVSVLYTNKVGKKIDPTQIVQGTDFYADVTIQNTGVRGVYRNMALKQIFPSGWEIHNIRMDNMNVIPSRSGTNANSEDDEEGSNIQATTSSNLLSQLTGNAFSVPTYQDFRDDRVNTFFDLLANEKKTFRVALNAAYLGKFYLPAVYSEAMYDGTINATVPGQWVEVIKPGGKFAMNVVKEEE